MVKGAYLEPPSVAYPKKADVDENFYKLCVRLLSRRMRSAAGALLHIATHDARARRSAGRIHRRAQRAAVALTSSRCSTAFSVGQQQRLVREGKRLRVLISYGEYWFPWYMRRLAERPANVWFVVKKSVDRAVIRELGLGSSDNP